MWAVLFDDSGRGGMIRTAARRRKGDVRVVDEAPISTAAEAAQHELVLAFGRLQGAANRLEHVLGRAIEVECGISHLMYEVLLILGRSGEPGLPMGAIATVFHGLFLVAQLVFFVCATTDD